MTFKTNIMNFTINEHKENLKRLDIDNYTSLIGENVYYINEYYGCHKVIDWCDDKSEYLLEYKNDRFWSNPFRINRK
jgi:hypothetical protein